MIPTQQTAPLTLELATAYMVSLTLVSHRTPFTCRDVSVDGAGRGQVTIVTLADTPTIQRWMNAVNLVAIGFRRDYTHHAWIVNWMPLP